MTVSAQPWQSDARVIGAVAVAHGFSHFFQLTLPPLFPAMKEEFGVGYGELGAVTGLFYAVSGIAQFAAGFVVDRFGARRVLLAGLTLLAASIFAVAFVPGYWALLPLAVAGGLGNCVFHPADSAIGCRHAELHGRRRWCIGDFRAGRPGWRGQSAGRFVPDVVGRRQRYPSPDQNRW